MNRGRRPATAPHSYKSATPMPSRNRVGAFALLHQYGARHGGRSWAKFHRGTADRDGSVQALCPSKRCNSFLKWAGRYLSSCGIDSRQSHWRCWRAKCSSNRRQACGAQHAGFRAASFQEDALRMTPSPLPFVAAQAPRGKLAGHTLALASGRSERNGVCQISALRSPVAPSTYAPIQPASRSER